MGDGCARRQGRRGGRDLRRWRRSSARACACAATSSSPRWSPTSSAAPGRARYGQGGCAPTSPSTWSTPRNTIANVCVGIVMVRIKTKSPELFFRYSKEARAAVHESDRAAGRDHPAHRAEPRSDQARRLAALHAAPRAAGVPDAHLRHDAQGALLPEELHGHVQPRVRDGLPAPHRARPDARDGA